ncbi:MAG TPA: diguanylate cyclase [Anaerolineales bacterium]|nr:diguanylate cyclase [Anaerolineales bacterium]HRF48019.1 diguanylate cyclase [Anaerolineales bacterium]
MVDPLSPPTPDYDSALQMLREALGARERELAIVSERLALAQRASGSGLWDWDLASGALYWSPELFLLFGLDPATRVAGAPTWHEVAHPDDLADLVSAIQQSVAQRRPLNRAFRILRRDGEVSWIRILGHTEIEEDRTPDRMVGICLDVTERTQMEAALHESDERFRSVLNNSSMAAYRRDLQADRYDYLSPVIEKVTGWSLEDMHRMSTETVLKLIHPDDLPAVAREITRTDAICRVEGRAAGQLEYRMRDPQGVYRWIGDSLTVLADATGALRYRLGMVRDIGERKRTEQLLLARMRLTDFGMSHTLDELLQATLDEAEALTESTIGFYHFVEADQETLALQMWSHNTLARMCTAEGKGSHYNISLAGVWVECVRERRSVIHNDYAGLPAGRRKGLPEGHAQVLRELVVPVFRGERIVAILGVGNKPNDYDQTDVAMVERLADLAWDTVGRKQAEDELRLANAQLAARLNEIQLLQEQLREQAIRDPLTGLYNRRYMQETFSVALAHAERFSEPIGVLMMDVDHFKAFNDLHGHKAGDLVLESLGRLLRATSRQMDIACRYGGEEFVLLMPGATLDLAAQRAEAWRAAFAAERLDDGGTPLQATLSVGVAAYPNHGQGVDALLRAADAALYRAKNAGRNCVRLADA